MQFINFFKGIRYCTKSVSIALMTDINVLATNLVIKFFQEVIADKIKACTTQVKLFRLTTLVTHVGCL